MTARSRRFRLMDSVRALAALSVLVFHAVGIYGGALSHPGRALVARLEVGVVIFLVVSGFLLYRPFVAEDVESGPRSSIRAYAWRRVLRIVPAYWVALVLAALLVPIHGVLSAPAAPTYFGFAQIYRSSTLAQGIAPAWTLGLELSFYAFLPLWVLAIRRLPARDARDRLRAHAVGVAGLWTFSVLYKVVLFATGSVGSIPSVPLPALVTLPGYLDEFALGMGLAVVSVALEGSGGLGWGGGALGVIRRRPGVAWVFALAAYLLVSLGIGLTGDPAQHYTPAQYLARNVLYGAVAVGVIVPAAFFGDSARGWVRSILAHPALLWIGLISYGIYLWHAPLLTRMLAWGYGQPSSHVLKYLEWLVVPLLGSVMLGALSYCAVERPARSLQRLVPARRPVDPRVGGEPAAPRAGGEPAGPVSEGASGSVAGRPDRVAGR